MSDSQAPAALGTARAELSSLRDGRTGFRQEMVPVLGKVSS